MHLSREIAGGNGEILELRIGGENVTAHRQMKTHRKKKPLISAGEEENIQNQLEPTAFFFFFAPSKNHPQCQRGATALVYVMLYIVVRNI